MTGKFFASPPSRVPLRNLGALLKEYLSDTVHIIFQVMSPFEARPGTIDPVPPANIEITEHQVSQCQDIFDQSIRRMERLEHKAESTFSVMTFLVPALAAVFVFAVDRIPLPDSSPSTMAKVLVVTAAVFLAIGFVSATRAVGVKGVETLYMHSVVDEDGNFKRNSRDYHARGLLYCASINQAMNDHLAQFVKGAHLCIAIAVGALALAVVPISFALRDSAASPDVGSEIAGIRDEVRALKYQVHRLTVGAITREDVDRLRMRVEAVEGRVRQIDGTE